MVPGECYISCLPREPKKRRYLSWISPLFLFRQSSVKVSDYVVYKVEDREEILLFKSLAFSNLQIALVVIDRTSKYVNFTGRNLVLHCKNLLLDFCRDEIAHWSDVGRTVSNCSQEHIHGLVAIEIALYDF